MRVVALESHEIELPKKIIIGGGVITRLSEVAKEIGLEVPFAIISGPNVYRLYGYLLEEVLERANIDYQVFEAKEATIKYAEKLVDEIRAVRARTVVGFGGGKSIDLAKYVAMKLGTRIISIPTSASHDGIASPFISLKDHDKPYSFKGVVPSAIIADIDIISKAPLRLLRAGSGDLIAKLTAVRDWKLAHKLKNEYYGDYAAKLALLSAKHIIEYAALIRRGGAEATRIVVEGLISSGIAMCVAGSTRPASGSEHLFSHALDVIAPGHGLHGEKVAIGTIMMMYLHGGKWRKVREAVRRIGLPVKAREIGLSNEHVIKALTIAHKIRPERYTILGETGLTWEAAENLARVTGVID
ncbi:MAG: NAD(P)-dependent glycerol-1-phosphate dehydrogenase [Pyrodictiaceae archaeon]